MGYFKKLRVYDDGVAQDFSLPLIPLTRAHAIIVVRGLSIELALELISNITTLPLRVPQRKEDKEISRFPRRSSF